MKSCLFYSIAILSTIFFFSTSQVNGQTLCTQTNLTIDWKHSFGHSGDDVAWDIEPIDADADGSKDDGFVVVGEAYSNSTGFDAFVLRLDANGDSVWGKIFDGGASPAQEDVAYAVEETSTDSLNNLR